MSRGFHSIHEIFDSLEELSTLLFKKYDINVDLNNIFSHNHIEYALYDTLDYTKRICIQRAMHIDQGFLSKNKEMNSTYVSEPVGLNTQTNPIPSVSVMVAVSLITTSSSNNLSGGVENQTDKTTETTVATKTA